MSRDLRRQRSSCASALLARQLRALSLTLLRTLNLSFIFLFCLSMREMLFLCILRERKPKRRGLGALRNR